MLPRLTRAPCLLVYVSVSFPQVTSFVGSRPSIFATWLFCSYPSGLALLLLQLCVLEALLTCVEAIDGMHCQTSRPWRYWRGHFSRRWVVALPSYNWGFAGYWVSTAVVMYLFNHHQVCAPGVRVGTEKIEWSDWFNGLLPSHHLGHLFASM